MDNALSVLGPQLVHGKPVTLTKSKKAALAAWSGKFALMLQLVYPREWVQIWPAIGTSRWPPPECLATGRLTPIAVGIGRGQVPRGQLAAYHSCGEVS